MNLKEIYFCNINPISNMPVFKQFQWDFLFLKYFVSLGQCRFAQIRQRREKRRRNQRGRGEGEGEGLSDVIIAKLYTIKNDKK